MSANIDTVALTFKFSHPNKVNIFANFISFVKFIIVTHKLVEMLLIF